MLAVVTIANAAGTDIVLHEDTNASKRFLVSAEGLLGVGNLRDSKRVRPSAHGSINETSFEEGRSIHLVGEVWGTTIQKGLEEMHAVSGVMLETLDNGAALLKWTEAASGLKLQMLVKLDSSVTPILQEGAGFIQYTASLFAEDPRSYTQAQLTAKGAGITGSAYEATFLKTLNKALAVCVDAGHIYWVDGATRAIGRATLAGGTIENEWIKTSGEFNFPQALAIDAGHVYWSTPRFGGTLALRIGRATIAGATIENEWSKFAAPESFGDITALAVNGSNIFYSGTGHSIGRSTIAGTESNTNWLTLPTGFAAKSLALDATNLYYGLGNEIGRVKLTGAENERVWMNNTGSVLGLAVNATFIYWLSSTGKAVGRAKLNGTEPNSGFIVGLEAEPSGLAINTEHIYWCESTAFIARSKELAGGGPVGSAVKSKNTGNRPTPLVLKIVGPILNPTVIRKSDGARISLRGEVTTGNFVEINTATRTVQLNGTSNALSMLDAGSTDWSAFMAPPSAAEEEYSLTGSSATAATLEILYRSAYA